MRTTRIADMILTSKKRVLASDWETAGLVGLRLKCWSVSISIMNKPKLSRNLLHHDLLCYGKIGCVRTKVDSVLVRTRLVAAFPRVSKDET